MKLTNTKEPMTSKDYFEYLVESEDRSFPLLNKPCHDCAITTGFYVPVADELLEQTEQLQDEVLKVWYCHNEPDCACRGVYNYIQSMRKKKQVQM